MTILFRRAKSLWVMTLISVFAFLPHHAYSASFTGNEMYQLCSADDDLSQFICDFYFAGIHEGLAAGAFTVLMSVDPTVSTEKMNEHIQLFLGYCVDETVTREQLGDVITRYLKDNPQNRHHSARLLYREAMMEAFPCN